MEQETVRDLENERQELIEIMIKNIPDQILNQIKTTSGNDKNVNSNPIFSISTEGTSYAK